MTNLHDTAAQADGTAVHALAGTSTPEAQGQQGRAESAIRAAVDRWLRAVLARDVDGIMSHYAPDVLSFDAIAALRFKGAAAYRKHWEMCMSLCSGEMIFEIHDFGVMARGDLAVCHFLTRCGAKGEDGQEKASWMRATVCLREVDGRWLIVHEHYSAPFDVQSGKAMFDLQP